MISSNNKSLFFTEDLFFEKVIDKPRATNIY